MSTVARSLRGTLVGSINFAVTAAQAVVLVPLLLAGWGTDRYAHWTATYAATSLLLVLSSGYQSYVGNELAKLLPVDRAAAGTTLGSSIRGAFVLGAIELSVVVALARSDYLGRLLGASAAIVSSERLGASLVVLVASWILGISIPGIVAKLYPPAGHFVRGTWWGIGQRLLFAATLAGMASSGASILATACAMAAATLAWGWSVTIECWWRFRDLTPFLARGTLTEGMPLVVRSLPVTGSTLMIQLQTNGLILLVSAWLSPLAVASFATLRTLSNTLLQASGTIFLPATPELIRFQVSSEWTKLRQGLYGLMMFASLPAAAGALALAGAGEPLYTAWTRSEVPFDRPVFHLIAAAVLWRIAGSPLCNQLVAMNHTRWISLWAVAQTSAALLGAAALTPSLGLRGVAWGMLLGEVVGSLVLPARWLQGQLPSEERRRFRAELALAWATPAIASVTLLACAEQAAFARSISLAAGLALCLGAFGLQYRQLPLHLRQQLWSAVARWRSRA